MNERKLQIYASVAEVVSAVAIVVSLIYAASELRRTTTMSSRDADVVLFERVREANRLIIESPRLAEVVVLAETDPEQLTAADRLRFVTYQHDFFDAWEIGWSYFDDGILDEATWNEWDEWFGSEARRRPGFAWTENRRHFTDEAFRQHVDGVLAVER